MRETVYFPQGSDGESVQAIYAHPGLLAVYYHARKQSSFDCNVVTKAKEEKER